MKKLRIDAVLAERGMFPSRSAAALAVRAGEVRIGPQGPLALKPSELVEPRAELIVADKPRYVSRGGIKLANALERFGLDVEGLDCLDVGASTGGFSDCLLQRGAARITALDVGTGQLHQRLREDARVTVIEGRNAREMEPSWLPFAPDLAVVDVSFISLRKLLPALAGCLRPNGAALAMVKPQFELGRGRIGRGGVVRSAADRREAVREVVASAARLGLATAGVASSGLPGPKGNRETFIWCGFALPPLDDLEGELEVVEA